MRRQRKIGLALGGGGARGFAHLGVMIALEEHCIPIDCISGTSIGAAMGAAKAIGLNLDRLRRVLNCLDLNALLQVSDKTIRELQRAIGRGVIEYMRGPNWRETDTAPQNLARLYELFSLLTANKSFDDIVIPFAAVAADIESGDRVVLTEGKLYQAVTASAAIPGTFSPVFLQGRYLIDGGVIEKIPVEVTIDMGADTIIAVDTGAPLTRSVNTSLDSLMQSQRITSQELTELQIANARRRIGDRLILLRPNVGWINMLAFEHMSEAIDAGREEALSHMDEIKQLCGSVVSADVSSDLQSKKAD